MIFKLIVIFLINLTTFGGGAVYIPIYEFFYTDLFNIVDQSQYFTIVAIQNTLPGVTGGKLASFAMYLTDGIPGFLLGSFVFILPFVFIIIITLKYLELIETSSTYQVVTTNIKPVVVGILLSISYDFFVIGLQLKLTFLIYLAVGLLAIFKYKINIVFIIIFSIILGIILI